MFTRATQFFVMCHIFGNSRFYAIRLIDSVLDATLFYYAEQVFFGLAENGRQKLNLVRKDILLAKFKTNMN